MTIEPKNHGKVERFLGYDKKPTAIPPLGLRLRTAIQSAGLKVDTIRPLKPSKIPPWTMNKPNVFLSLSDNKKSTTNPLEFQSKFNELISHYPHYTAIYTDGSKDSFKVGCASVSELHTSKVRFPVYSSIFSAETLAIDLALRFILKSSRQSFIIFSDSLSVLQSLLNLNTTNPLIQQLLLKHHNISKSKNIKYCWLPGHVGWMDG